MTPTTETLLRLAADCGFDHAAPLCVSALHFDPAVREMCAADRCRSYGKNWCCPPACGSLEDFARRAAAYHRGILLQSTGQLEDDFDADTMMATERLQKERFFRFVQALRPLCPDCMPLSSGACSVCERCTCPDAPCRFPEKAFPSMEAAGLLVSQVCRDSGLPYYYGPRTINYTACVLTD